jgi:para-nitrobenzyl esterase
MNIGEQITMIADAIQINSGKIRGLTKDGVTKFLGIPYGDDTSRYRFRPARPPAPWTQQRDCLQFGASAPQGQLNVNGLQVGTDPDPDYTSTLGAIFGSGTTEQPPESEDCLVLNVFTPQAFTQNKRPTMVWLHGGGFSMGSASSAQYDGSALCRRGDVVVVTVNHRLSALGYLYLAELHNDFADSGNIGQLDIILALEWVRDNITAFGGDPYNVTIFGESGGGAKVSALMAMPAARRLFHKAIIQSGPSAKMMERDEAASITLRTLATLSLGKTDVHKLLSMDRNILLAAASAAQNPSNGIVDGALAPVVDGRSLPAHPFYPVAGDLSRDIPLLIGTTKDEWTLMTAIEPRFGTMNAEQAKERFIRALGDRGAAVFAFYQSLTPASSPTYWVTDMMTDLMIRTESIAMAERQAALHEAPVYMYRLDWYSPALGGALRSPHSLDVPLIFENTQEAGQFVGSEAGIMAATMAQAWVNFARTGNPSQPNLQWIPYGDTRSTMIFDTESRLCTDPDRERRQFWSEIRD